MNTVESLIIGVCKWVVIVILLKGVITTFVHSQSGIFVFIFYTALIIGGLTLLSVFNSDKPNGIISKFKK